MEANTATRRSSSSRRYARRSLQSPELAVVQAAGDLLAVPGDERNGRAVVQQLDRGGHPALVYRQFLSETGVYGLDGLARSHAETLPNAGDSSG